MGDRISQLPDDILSYILSFLIIRDAVKTRLLSHRWRHLSPSLSLLQFDNRTVFGNAKGSKFKFITAVDQVLLTCRGPKLGTLKVHYTLGNDSAFHIDNWIAFSIGMQVEKIDFDFSSYQPQNCEKYSFPCHVFPIDKTSNLKHLCLAYCTLRLSSELTSRLNSLRTLDLDCVTLGQGDMECILSGCSKLAWLALKDCNLPKNVSIHGQLLCLKTLIIHDCHISVELNSINLEIFEFYGRPRNFIFVDVPHLKRAVVRSVNLYTGTSPICNALAMDLPQLQFLNLLVNCEVLPLPASSVKFNSLKELDLSIMAWKESDLFTITYLLNACPLLEILRLKVHPISKSRGKRAKREYSRHTFLHLKEVELKGFGNGWNEMELVIYLLKNSTALERMEIVVCWHLECAKQRISDLLQREKINSSTELVVL